MMKRILSIPAAVFAIVAVLLVAPGRGEDAPPAAKITYDEHVKPIFREHCFSCHNQDTKKSDLNVASFAGVLAGGSTGGVVEPGDPDASRLWSLVAHIEEPKMPPGQDKLPQAKLDTIKAWITGGALENNGSVAKMKKKPGVELAVTSGAGKPEGPPPMPEKISRQPLVYTPRASAITAIACSPWAPLAAVAGQKQISLYNTDSGALLTILPFPEGVAHVLKFSRSGSLLLAGGGVGAKNGTVIVFDVKTGERVFEVGDELDVVLAADINEDHTRIALGGPGRVVRIFSTADGSLLHEIRKHTEWIYALEFSPDGVLLATSDRNGGLFVWEAETAREFQNLAGHKAGVTDVSWRVDSNVLASSSEDGTIKLWEMDGGKEIKNIAAHAGGVTALEYARDGRLASVGRDRLTKVWDANGAVQREFPAFGDQALEVALSHDLGRIVAGDWLGEVRMSDVADGKQVALLAANPPTLEMLVQAQTNAVQAAQAAAQKAAAELAAAEAVVAEKAKVAKAAADAAAAAQAGLDSLAAEKAAVDQAQMAQAAK
jgi:mono/diheme cytochrome c family protein